MVEHAEGDEREEERVVYILIKGFACLGLVSSNWKAEVER